MADSSYRDLGKKNSTLTRVVSRQQLPRLAEVCGLEDDVDVEASFRIDDRGRVNVSVRLDGTVSLDCYRCNETVVQRLQMAFDAVVAFDETRASEWAAWSAANDIELEHIIVASSQTLDVAELIEDELMLGLPLQVLCEEGCTTGRGAHAEDGHVRAASTDRQMPFEGLRELIAERAITNSDATSNRDKGGS